MYFNLGIVLAGQGADLLVTVASWLGGGSGLYDRVTRQNAYLARRWYVVSNQVGSAGHMIGYGHSRIVAPDGDIIADTGGEEGMVIGETDIMIDVVGVDPLDKIAVVWGEVKSRSPWP